jgi:DUF2993 family protein
VRHSRTSPWPRRLLIGLAILLALLVGADVGARAIAQNVAATQVASSLKLSRKPSVSLGGFPFIPRAISGHLPSVTVGDRDFTAEGGILIQSVRLTLRDVRFPSGMLLTKKEGTVRASSGDGTATLTGQAVTDALHRAGADVNVRFEGGEVLLTSGEFPGQLRGDVSVGGDTLVVRPVGSDRPFSVPLPHLISGLDYRSARVEGSVAVLGFQLADPAFRIG